MCAYGLIGQRGPNLQIHTTYLRILLEAKILCVLHTPQQTEPNGTEI